MVSRSWKALTPEERAPWEKLAERDRARFEVERSHYKGPWQVSKNGKATLNDGAPKRPMSAFLAFVESHRQQVKADFPKMNAVEITAYLSKEWKVAPECERAFFFEKNRLDRQLYDQNMAEYRQRQESGLFFPSPLVPPRFFCVWLSHTIWILSTPQIVNAVNKPLKKKPYRKVSALLQNPTIPL